MSVLPWYNENQFRHYPLQEGSAFPLSHIVDAGFTLRASVRDEDAFVPEIRLFKIVKTGAVLEFHLTTPTAYIVTVPLAAADYSTYSVFKRDAATCESPNTFAGSLTVADIPQLASTLETGDNIINVVFDPAVCDLILEQAVSHMRVANVHKRQSGNFGDCGIPRPILYLDEGFVLAKTGTERRAIVYQQPCPSDKLRIISGTNAAIAVNTVVKQITFAVSRSETLPQCQEIPISSLEHAALAAALPTLSPQRCSQVVTSVNGLPGPHVSLVGGAGVTIRKKDATTLQIILNDPTTGVCPGS
jgi:hypothetical protein